MGNLKIRYIVRNIIENFEFKDSQKHKVFKPTQSMINNAKKALEVISSNNLLKKDGGNEGTGVRKAKKIADGEDISYSMLKRMKAFFDNNSSEYTQEKSAGKNINNSGVIQSWNLWGGDDAKVFVNQKIDSGKKTNLSRKETRRTMSTTGSGDSKRLIDTNYYRNK